MGASQSQLGSPGRAGPPMDGPQGQAGVSCLSWPGSGGVPSAAAAVTGATSTSRTVLGGQCPERLPRAKALVRFWGPSWVCVKAELPL